MEVEFRVLGDVEVHVDGRAVDIGHSRQRGVLLALLVDVNRVVALDQLVDRVWAGRPPRGVGTLYNYVSRIRGLLAGADGVGVVRRPGGYQLTVDELAVDLHRFDHLVARARAAGDGEATALFAEALGLWRGEAFATLDTPWLNAVRDVVTNRRIAAELDRDDIELRRGRHHDVLPGLAARAAARPLDERLAGQLMLALDRCGRRADALGHYEVVRSRLAEELGIDPGPALRTLRQRILTADPALEIRPAETVRPAITPPGPITPAQLPPAVAGFTGRDRELADLDGTLASIAPGSAGVVLVAGTAGVGKTALAVRWAHRIADRFPDGQLHVNLRGYDPEQPVVAADALAGFLRALGVAGAAVPLDPDERAARYRSVLSGRRVLVLLDNASSADQVRPLLPGTPGCVAVVTSRDSLGGLVALDGAYRMNLGLLPLDDAVALLRRLIGARVTADPAAAAELAGHCARLPLALRVAAELAATDEHTGLAALNAELADRPRRLDLLDAGEVRSAVRSVFSWSYRRLPADAARVFRLLGLHPGPDADRHAVAALAGVTVDHAAQITATLARAHLVHAAEPGRYGRHDLLRAYAIDLAAAHDAEADRRTALTRLFDHYLGTAAAAMDALHPAERHKRPATARAATPAAPRAWLDAERPNLVAMCAHGAAHGWENHAIALARTLFRYLDIGGHHAEALAVHADAHRAARLLGDRSAEARALNNTAAVHWWRADYRTAGGLYRQAASLFRACGDDEGETDALANLGAVHQSLGDLPAAAAYRQEALDRHRRVGNAIGAAHSLTGLGVIRMMQGSAAVAADHHREAIDLFRAAGKPDGEADALANLGLALLRRGERAAALEPLERALALYRRHGYTGGEARTLTYLGRVHHALDDLTRAARSFREGLALLRRGGTRHGEPAALNGLGRTTLATGATAEARRHHTAALALARELGDRYEQAWAHQGLAATLGAVEGRDHLERALLIFTELGTSDADDVRARLIRHDRCDDGEPVRGQ
ncbi:BTAD domain-containing putative transcriptional regulator [Actinoplanes sp. NBRC 103695]|uniref:AfsR/SARP family transcriptional regulator n=1 Tax=Actinoplanes sp. NBRC 103695 TaxID=3032202 RepID=UPI0024A1138C|nr:BTAD domain-containing putative transcriptional regulator [Actinoplanes sp. NBRC 103695]GLY97854.1 XRE family transcriptional regulator [Actinoplanes sp. NBRC 103695]